MLDVAIRIAAEAFEGKRDKNGEPYILHCLQVMNDCGTDDEDIRCAAVLHDLLEDCGDKWNEAKLYQSGFSECTVSLIKLLSHDPGDEYDMYIALIAGVPEAAMIKMADLRHNSDIRRMKGLKPKDFKRLEKYARAYNFLSLTI